MLDIKKYIKNIIVNTGINIDNIDVQKAPKEDMGDFAFPCFKVNINGLNNPNEKAKYIKDKINIHYNIISEVFVMGPYFNFKINREFLASETLKTIKMEDNTYGSSNIGIGQDLLIEHTSINPNASPHIGRSRNSIIGDFLVKLYKFQGFNVETNYFINDVGKQISMLLVGVEKLGNINTISFNDMLGLYIKVNELSKANKDIEEKVFYYLNELEKGNEEIRSKFKKITDICIKGQQEIFSKMDIKWDKFTSESDFVFDNTTNKILEDLQKTGKLHEDENGRLYVDLTGYILGYDSPNLVSYSFVLLNGDKMATREGKVVLLEEFIEKAKEKISQKFKEKGSELDEESISNLASACIRYNMLNVNRKKTVNFNLESATDFQGNSAIYLLYNYARIVSILEKANYCNNDPEMFKFKENLEYSLIKKLYEFPETITNAYNSQESVVITNYLFDIAQKFSKYYENISILNEKDEVVRSSRLALLNSTKTVLSNGMKLLGIKLIKKF